MAGKTPVSRMLARELQPGLVALALIVALAVVGLLLNHAATYKPPYPGLNAPKPAAERAGFAQMMARQRPAHATPANWKP